MPVQLTFCVRLYAWCLVRCRKNLRGHRVQRGPYGEFEPLLHFRFLSTACPYCGKEMAEQSNKRGKEHSSGHDSNKESRRRKKRIKASAEEWDRGGPLCDADLGCVIYDSEEMGESEQPLRRAWLELAVCVVLDLAGIASYFYPFSGEFADVPFAVLYGFTIDLFFDWPALALFGFWEVP